MKIFLTFCIVSIVIAIALPVGVFIVLMNMSAGGASGIPLWLAIYAAPFIVGAGVILGAILQVIYNFVVCGNLFKKPKFLPLSQDSKEIKHLEKQGIKNRFKRFFIVIAVIIVPSFTAWLYTQSDFYPCSIYDAVSQGDVKRVEKLLKNGANPNIVCSNDSFFDKLFCIIFPMYSPNTQTPLSRAIQDMVSGKTDFWLNINSPKANFRSDEIIKLLIEYGAIINEYYLSEVFGYASKEVIELFLSKGTFNGSESILNSALRRKDPQQYEEIVELAFALPVKESKQEMLDEVFCSDHKLYALKILLKHGANINTQNCDYGYTKLMQALELVPYREKESLELVIYLLEHGADVNRINNKGQSAFDMFKELIEWRYFSNKQEQNQVQKIKELLQEKGAKSGVELQKTLPPKENNKELKE